MTQKNGWDFQKIQDYPVQIIDGDRGVNYPKKEEFSDEGFCLFLNTGNVTLTGFDFTKNAFVSKEKHTKLRKGHLIRNDVILTTRGTVGNTAFYSNKIPYDVVRINSGMIILRPDTENIDPCFLYNVLRSEVFQKQVDSFKSGSAQPQLPIGTLNHITLPIPPLPVQKKIAGVLSAYDDLIENNNKRIKILEEMAQKLYKEWFVDFKFPNHENIKLIDSELGKIPDGWSVELVKEILDRRKAGTAYTQDDVSESGIIPVIDQSTSDVLGYHNNEVDHLATPENPIIIFGDHTCKMQLMIKPFSVGANVIPFVPKFGKPSSFIYYLVKSLVNTQEYKRHWTALISKKIVLPPDTLQHNYANNILPIIQQINKLQEVSLNLSKTRSLLLPRLISGELSVEDLAVKI